MLKFKLAITVVFIICYNLIAGFFCFAEDLGNITLPEQTVYDETLANGLKVILNKEPDSPLAAVYVLVKTGSAHEEGYWGSGISHLAEHMMFKGTAKRSAKELESAVKKTGGYTNGYTSFDSTGYIIVTQAGFAEKAVEILADQITNPLLKIEDFEKEKSVVLSELQLNIDDPDRYLWQSFWENAYILHPYRYPPIGYEQIFKSITLDDLRKYYHENYVPNNIIIAVSGNFDEKITLEKIKKEFLSFKPSGSVQNHTYIEPRQIADRKLVISRNVSQTKMILGFHTVSVQDSDMFALDLLAIILGEGESSLLSQNLYKQGLVHAISSFSYTPRDAGIFGISCIVADHTGTNTVLDTIWTGIKKVKSGKINRQQLQKAKRQILKTYIKELENQEGKASNMALNFYLTGDYNFAKKYVENIDKITINDIKKVAQKYLTIENSNIVILQPESKQETAQNKIDTSVPKPAKKIQLANGLNVILQEQKNLPIISISLAAKGGLYYENEKTNGLSNLTSLMLVKGSKKYPAARVAEISESKGITINGFSGNNSFGIEINALSTNIALALDILSDITINPAFDEKEFRLMKAAILSQIASIDDDIFAYTVRILKKMLYTQSPYRYVTLGSEASVSNITTKDLLSFYQNYFRPNNMVLSLTGDFNTDTITKIIEAKFTKLNKAAIPAPNIAIEPEITSQRNSYNFRRDKQQAVLVYGFHTVSMQDRRRYPLEVLTSILDDTGSRLYNKIRQEKGMSYTLGGQHMFGYNSGYYMLYVATKPEDLAIVRHIIDGELTDLNVNNISDEEIMIAKNSLIGRYKIQLESISAQGLDMALNELYGMGFDHYNKYADLINAVTRDEINQAINFLKLAKSALVITSLQKE